MAANSRTAWKLTPEGRRRISEVAREAQLRAWADPEHRARRVAAMKAAWAEKRRQREKAATS